jgi:DNA-binding FadR family transcriptional regulator
MKTMARADNRPETPAATAKPIPGVASLGDRRRTRKTSERTASDIVHDIVENGLVEGDQLPLEAAMVEQYGVSRSSMREALRLLEVQGLIRLKPGPGGGPTVGRAEATNLARIESLYFHLGGATYGQLLEAQVLHEPIVAELAARHPDRRAAMTPFFETVDPNDEQAYRDSTNLFHDAIYQLAGNTVVALLTKSITCLVADHVVATMDPVKLRSAILDEHVVMARAIAAGHASKARQLMAEHFQLQHDYFRAHWPARLSELIEWR